MSGFYPPMKYILATALLLAGCAQHAADPYDAPMMPPPFSVYRPAYAPPPQPMFVSTPSTGMMTCHQTGGAVMCF